MNIKVPTHLKHSPLLVVENYEDFDGPYKYKSDAKGLSIGIAQWNGAGETDLSAKVWRYTGGKWSRQSEELPLHRVFDLATLICTAMDYSDNGGSNPMTSSLPVTATDNLAEHERLNAVMQKEFLSNKEHLNVSMDRLIVALKKLGKI